MQMHQRRDPEVFSVPRSDMETVLSTGDIDSVTAKTMRPQDLAVTGRFKAMKRMKQRTSIRSISLSKTDKPSTIQNTSQSVALSTTKTGNTKETTEAAVDENENPRNPMRIVGIITGAVMVLSIIAVVVFVSLKFLVFDQQGTADDTHASTTPSRESGTTDAMGGTITSSSDVTLFGSTISQSGSKSTTNFPSVSAVLIIGGPYSNGVIEQLSPSAKSSTKIATQIYLDFNLNATPVNATHALVVVYHGPKMKAYYIDRTGRLANGPDVDFTPSAIIPLTSITGDGGQLRPLYIDCDGNNCQVKIVSEDLKTFEPHGPKLNMKLTPYSLTVFDKQLIAIGGFHAERYIGNTWTNIQPTRYNIDMMNSAAVKLNDSALLTCGGLRTTTCHVYNLDSEMWHKGPDMDATPPTMRDWKMVLIDETVYAFGGSLELGGKGTRNIQTLDISQGVLNAKWNLESFKLEVPRRDFGVWVIS